MPKGFDNLLTVLFASVVLAWLWFNRVAENWPISAAGKIYRAKRRSAAHFLGHRFFRAILSACKNKNP